MSNAERNEFLVHGARTGSLATVRPDGRPHVVPIWFALDEEIVVFTTWHASVKARNILNEPRVSLCVDDEEPPFAFVLIEGEATLTADDPDLRYWATKIAGRYMGDELAESYGERNSVEGELLGRISLINTVAQKNIAH